MGFTVSLMLWRRIAKYMYGSMLNKRKSDTFTIIIANGYL